MIKWLKYILRNYFGFSKSEVNGLTILGILVFFCCILLPIIKSNYQNKDLIPSSQDIILLDSLYNKLVSNEKKYIPAQLSANKSYIKNKKRKFNINTAEPIQLKKIYGVGEVLSKRIIKYRDKLGGFIHTSQYNDIYGLDSLVVQRIIQSTFIDKKFVPKKMDINKYNLKQLAQHPYLSYACARNIIRYRAQHGAFHNIMELRKVVLVDSILLKKVAPYLHITSSIE